MTTAVRLLSPADAAAFCALRAEALLDAPHAFLASPEDDVASTPDHIAAHLLKPGYAIAGAFVDARLVAIAGMLRSSRLKSRHRASIWGVYASPAFRAQGLAKHILQTLITTARSWDGVEVLGLSASEHSHAAIRLYTSLGFTEWGREPDALRVNGRSNTEIYMQLSLRPLS